MGLKTDYIPVKVNTVDYAAEVAEFVKAVDEGRGTAWDIDVPLTGDAETDKGVVGAHTRNFQQAANALGKTARVDTFTDAKNGKSRNIVFVLTDRQTREAKPKPAADEAAPVEEATSAPE